MDYKRWTKKTYNNDFKYFEEKFKKQFEEVGKVSADKFLAALKGNHILDLGAGPGDYASYFREKGYNVFCIDNSKEMIGLCHKKGLSARLMDIENLEFPAESFDGIWAYASLLHMPKSHLRKNMEELHYILKGYIAGTKGVLGLAVKSGEGEGFEDKSTHPQFKRWFSYFTEDEIIENSRGLFNLIHKENSIVAGKDPFIKFLFEKII